MINVAFTHSIFKYTSNFINRHYSLPTFLNVNLYAIFQYFDGLDYNEIKIFPGTGRYDAKNNAYMKGN